MQRKTVKEIVSEWKELCWLNWNSFNLNRYVNRTFITLFFSIPEWAIAISGIVCIFKFQSQHEKTEDWQIYVTFLCNICSLKVIKYFTKHLHYIQQHLLRKFWKCLCFPRYRYNWTLHKFIHSHRHSDSCKYDIRYRLTINIFIETYSSYDDRCTVAKNKHAGFFHYNRTEFEEFTVFDGFMVFIYNGGWLDIIKCNTLCKEFQFHYLLKICQQL